MSVGLREGNVRLLNSARLALEPSSAHRRAARRPSSHIPLHRFDEIRIGPVAVQIAKTQTVVSLTVTVPGRSLIHVERGSLEQLGWHTVDGR